MSTEKIYGELYFNCDSCNANICPDTGEFATDWKYAKREGWTCYKIDDEWRHACPTCKKKLGC